MILHYCGTDFTDSESSIRGAHGTELAQKQTKTTKKNPSFAPFVPFCSKEIRAIRAIHGKIFAKMSDSDGLQCKDRKKQHKLLSLRSLRVLLYKIRDRASGLIANRVTARRSLYRP